MDTTLLEPEEDFRDSITRFEQFQTDELTDVSDDEEDTCNCSL